MSITGTSVVDRCRFENIGGGNGGEGLRAENGTCNGQVTRCYFRECFNIAIHWLEQATGSSSLIEADTIKNVAIRPAYGSKMGTLHEKRTNLHYNGIAVSYGQNMRIRYNVTDSTGYAGINLHDDNNTVEYNVINHGMVTLNDGGGIYCLTNNSTFRNNIILNTVGETWAGKMYGMNICHGLWLEYLHGYHDNKVINNTIAWNPQHGFWLPNNWNTTVTGNTCFGNRNDQMAVDAFEHPTTSNQGNTINQNIFFCETSDQVAFSWETGLNFGTMSGNWFCKPVYPPKFA